MSKNFKLKKKSPNKLLFAGAFSCMYRACYYIGKHPNESLNRGCCGLGLLGVNTNIKLPLF